MQLTCQLTRRRCPVNCIFNKVTCRYSYVQILCEPLTLIHTYMWTSPWQWKRTCASTARFRRAVVVSHESSITRRSEENKICIWICAHDVRRGASFFLFFFEPSPSSNPRAHPDSTACCGGQRREGIIWILCRRHFNHFVTDSVKYYVFLTSSAVSWGNTIYGSNTDSTPASGARAHESRAPPDMEAGLLVEVE